MAKKLICKKNVTIESVPYMAGASVVVKDGKLEAELIKAKLIGEEEEVEEKTDNTPPAGNDGSGEPDSDEVVAIKNEIEVVEKQIEEAREKKDKPARKEFEKKLKELNAQLREATIPKV